MDEIRIGVIGVRLGRWHVQAFQGKPGSRVTAVCDLNEELVEAVGEECGVAVRTTNWEDLIASDDIDAVSLCTPNFLHAPHAIAALNAGKHVLIEKPLALTPEEGEAIKAAAAANNKTAMVAMKMRYGKDTAYARKVIADGELGPIYYGINSLVRPFIPLPDRPWFCRKETGGGGALFDNGVHALDLHWYIVGRPKPVQVMGSTWAKFGPKGKMVPKRDAATWDVEDFGVAMVKFDDDSTILVENAWIAHATTNIMRLEVYGELGGLNLWPLRIAREKDEKADIVEPNMKEIEIEAPDQFQHFLDCIREGKEPCSSVDDGITLLRMLCAMYESAEKGRSVDL